MIDYFARFTGTPWGRSASVHGKSNKRFDKAKEELEKEPTPINLVIDYVNEWLDKYNMPKVDNPFLRFGKNGDYLNTELIDYKKIQLENNLKDYRDLIWLKFIKEGHVGVIAQSADINFDIPKSENDYNLKEKWNWKHTTSGILVHKLGKEWDESFVLVFPLRNIPNGLNRHKIETAIGNYLINKSVSILDFYSHNY